MRRRPAVVATALVGVLLAVMAAASGAGNGRLERSLGVRSVLVSVLLTLAGLAVVAGAGYAISLFLRRGGGEETTEEREPVSRLAKAVLILALLLLGLGAYLLLASAHGAHPRAHLAGRGFGPRAAEHRGGRTVPFNGTASYLTVTIAVAALVLFGFRRRISALLRRARPFRPVVLEVSSGLPPRPAAGAPAQLLPDPNGIADPRLAVLAAYARFAALMSRAGRPRRQPETVFEYESRLASLPALSAGAGRKAARELSRLFATARYSPARVDEDSRRQALEDLAVIESQLAAGR